jgi:hypothetical protein
MLLRLVARYPAAGLRRTLVTAAAKESRHRPLSAAPKAGQLVERVVGDQLFQSGTRSACRASETGSAWSEGETTSI